MFIRVKALREINNHPTIVGADPSGDKQFFLSQADGSWVTETTKSLGPLNWNEAQESGFDKPKARQNPDGATLFTKVY